MNSTHKTSKLLVAIAGAQLAGFALTAPARAAEPDAAAQAEAEMIKMVGFVPSFAKAFPRSALPGIWEEVKGFELNKNTALDGKTKDLIGVAIAAQMPSRLTLWSYAKCGRASGATEAQIQEAVMLSAMSRHWSTFFNGMQLDETKFRAELGKLRENITKAMASGAKPPATGSSPDRRPIGRLAGGRRSRVRVTPPARGESAAGPRCPVRRYRDRRSS